MYPISHCAKMYSAAVGQQALARQNTDAGLALKAVAALALFVRPLLSAVCAARRCTAVAQGSWLATRPMQKKNSRRRELQLSACCNFAVEEQSRRLRLYFTTPQSALFQCVPGPPLVRPSHSYTHCAPQRAAAAPPTSIAHLELFY